MLFPSSDDVHNALAQILGKSLLHFVEFLVSLHDLQGAGCVGRDLRIAQLLEEVVTPPAPNFVFSFGRVAHFAP